MIHSYEALLWENGSLFKWVAVLPSRVLFGWSSVCFVSDFWVKSLLHRVLNLMTWIWGQGLNLSPRDTQMVFTDSEVHEKAMWDTSLYGLQWASKVHTMISTHLPTHTAGLFLVICTFVHYCLHSVIPLYKPHWFSPKVSSSCHKVQLVSWWKHDAFLIVCYQTSRLKRLPGKQRQKAKTWVKNDSCILPWTNSTF